MWRGAIALTIPGSRHSCFALTPHSLNWTREPATPHRTSCLVCNLAVPVSLRQPTGRDPNLDVHSNAIDEVSGCLPDAGRGRAAAVRADDEDLVPREPFAEVAAAVLCVGPLMGVVQPRLVPVAVPEPVPGIAARGLQVLFKNPAPGSFLHQTVAALGVQMKIRRVIK